MMPVKDETDPSSVLAGEEHQTINKILESALSEWPNEFGVFDKRDRLTAASNGLIERCDLERDPLLTTTLNETLRRLAMKITTIDGEKVEDSNLLSQSIFQRLKAPNNKAVEIEFGSEGWRLVYLFSISTGGHILQCVDITHQKEAAASDRHTNELVRRILEACPFALVMARSSDLKILYESPANNEMFGEEEETKAEHIGEYDVDPSRRQLYLEQLRKYGFVKNFEMRFRGLNGNEFVAALSGRVIDFEGEQVIVSGAVDLTERLSVERELAQQREALFQSEKLSALGELLAGVSHELNNPLSVLVGQSQLLQETTSDPEIANRVDKINAAAGRCARIVKSFLAMARQQPAEHEPVNMNEVVQSAVEVTGYSLRSANIELKLKLAERLPKIMGDPDQLVQVVTNLIVNAQHALDEIEGARLLCLETAYCDSVGQVTVKVTDNGPGIPEEVSNRIFEPLFTTKDGGMGTGMGLALCHRIIKSHSGTIVVQSLQRESTVFTVRLPAMLASESSPQMTAETNSDSFCLKILVVDDESDVADLIHDILSYDGHICKIASSGREALGMLSKTRFDVILSDIRMPEMGGQGLYSVINEEHPDLTAKMGFITGDTLSKNARSFLTQVQRPYIEKPITPDDIRDLISKITSSS